MYRLLSSGGPSAGGGGGVFVFFFFLFFFNDTATTEIYTLSLHDALPIYEIKKEAHCTRQGLFQTILLHSRRPWRSDVQVRQRPWMGERGHSTTWLPFHKAVLRSAETVSVMCFRLNRWRQLAGKSGSHQLHHPNQWQNQYAREEESCNQIQYRY